MSSFIFYLRLTVAVYFVDIFFKNIRQGLAKLHAFASHPATSEVKALSNEGFRFARVPGIAQERCQENSSFPVEESRPKAVENRGFSKSPELVEGRVQ